MNPFKLKPIFKDYLWGGNKLAAFYGKKTDKQTVAESWELSARPSDSSIISTGGLKGMPFYDFVNIYPDTLGTNCKNMSRFPVLVKLIDAGKQLSVQVHPDDDYAMRVEHEMGKTEMWVVLEAEAGAFVYCGFRDGVTRGEFLERIQNVTLIDAMHSVPVKKGDVLFIRPGTVHAIGAGILLAEIQQNSDTTYRIYDYGRLDKNGKQRTLHIKKALDVIDFNPSEFGGPGSGFSAQDGNCRMERLAACPYFTVDRLTLKGAAGEKPREDSFASYLCVEGGFRLSCRGEELNVFMGESLFVPAGAPEMELEGEGIFLKTTV